MPEAAVEIAFHAPSRKDIQRVLQRRAQVTQERLRYIHDALSWEQGEFLRLLPFLLHVNHPALPGYLEGDVPAGIAGYEPDRYTLLSVRQYAQSLKREQRAQRYWPILGLYLIGSSGTLAQERSSDFDIWVCHHPQLTPAQLATLEEKTRLLEAVAAERGLEVHFFVLHAEGFRQRQHNALSDESSGNTQHHLLLEEFYRTGLMLAGRPPLWWIVPPERDLDYHSYAAGLLSRGLVQEDDWLDFGGLDEISPAEFFSAAHWQLFKGIRVPYKSLLKLLLFESFASEFPNVRWVAEEANALYQGEDELTAIDVDPYLLMMRRIERHLQAEGDRQRLELARRAFYIKSDARLSRARENWKTPILQSLCQEWGWDEGEFINLDRVNEWKLARVMEERGRLVTELTRVYRLLTAFAREQDMMHEIDTRELSLLGRKLYSALERRPGKIDSVNPGISKDIHQEVVWLRRDPESSAWQCFLAPPAEQNEPIKTTASFVELLAWLSTNQVIDKGTRFDLGTDSVAVETQEHLHILRVLGQHFPASSRKTAGLEAFSQAARGQRALVVINALESAPHLMNGLLRVSERGDPLSFGTRRLNLVAQVDHVHANNWGELHVSHHTGASGLLDMLCRHLELFVHQTEPGSLACFCDTPGHGISIARRVSALGERLLKYFHEQDDNARYILQVGEEFHAIQRMRAQFGHHPIGNTGDLLNFLGEHDETFRHTEIDAAGPEVSLLAAILRLNKPGRTQICYHPDHRNLHAFILDAGGKVITQQLQNAGEAHFLVQLERFFSTVREWHGPVLDKGQDSTPEYIRITRSGNEWDAKRVRPPQQNTRQYTELILSTGPKGPWQDGFSLMSGEREFNSVALGQKIFSEVTGYLKGLRRGDKNYPFYLTGVMAGELTLDTSLTVADLLRFKVRIEQRLNQAARLGRG